MELSEKKERILQSYRQSYDKKMAYRKVGVTEEEVLALEADAEFQLRMDYLLIGERENLFTKLKNLSISENESVALKATMELGKILYPSKFGAEQMDKETSITPEEVEGFFNGAIESAK